MIKNENNHIEVHKDSKNKYEADYTYVLNCLEKLIYSDFESKVNKYTEDNKFIFQRALTEIQIKDF